MSRSEPTNRELQPRSDPSHRQPVAGIERQKGEQGGEAEGGLMVVAGINGA